MAVNTIHTNLSDPGLVIPFSRACIPHPPCLWREHVFDGRTSFCISPTRPCFKCHLPRQISSRSTFREIDHEARDARLDTTAPLHHYCGMRLTVNLESEMYALAKSLAREEGCTISVAVNRLLRRSVTGGVERSLASVGKKTKRSGFIVSRGTKPITADTVRRAEKEDDES